MSALDSVVKKKKKDCVVCRNIRYFLIIAALLLVMVWSQPGWALPGGFDYSTLVGDLFLLAFLLTFGWKFWVYYRDKDK